MGRRRSAFGALRGDWIPNASGVVHELRDGGRTLYAVVCDDPKRTPFQYAWQLFEEAADWMTSLAQLPRCESPSPCLRRGARGPVSFVKRADDNIADDPSRESYESLAVLGAHIAKCVTRRPPPRRRG